jgi:hypothetical protein
MRRHQILSVLRIIETTQRSTAAPHSVRQLKLFVQTSATGTVHRLSPVTTVVAVDPTNAQCLLATTPFRLFQ